MKVYSYRTTEDDFIYILDGKVVLISYVEYSESAESGMIALGAEIIEVDEEGAFTAEIEADIQVSELTDETTVVLCASIMAFVNKNNL